MVKFIKQNWILILSILYILSPIDFLPEFLIGPLGLVDDLGLVILLILKAIYNYRKDSKKDTQLIGIKDSK